MKKFICLLLLPLFSLIFLCGCGEDKSSKDLQVLYESIIELCREDKVNNIFSSKENPNSISIKYTDEIQYAIDNVSPSTPIQKRYVALKYQQNILDYVFNYYENNSEMFYTVLSNNEYSNTDMNDLYASLESLKTAVEKFIHSYNSFVDATENGISDVMEFNLTNYSYELNKLIDSSFTFMYKFANMYEIYGIKDYSQKTIDNIKVKVDKSYLDIAYIVYLENFKSFDYSVGSRGICDLLPIVDNINEFNIISDLETIKTVSSEIEANLKESDPKYEEVNDILNNYLYAQEVFDQRVKNYKTIHSELDVYTITQYKFDLVSGVTYDNYIDTMSSSDKASIVMLENFVNNTYKKLIEKLSLVVA